jgi:hypothetical protein
MRIRTLEKFRGRNPKGYFQDLPRDVQYVAYWWLKRFVTRWERDLPPWRFAILVGQAKRLALTPPTSAWGRSMHAKRGGLAVQRRYRIEGRHPTEHATKARLSKQKRKNAAQRFEESGRPRVWHLSLD